MFQILYKIKIENIFLRDFFNELLVIISISAKIIFNSIFFNLQIEIFGNDLFKV